MNDPLTIIHGDALSSLRTMESESVQTCVTSPPYWGLRDYGHEFQIGLEKTPDEYVARLVEVFQEVKRVLRNDGTLWLNLGDSYAGSGPSGASYQSATTKRRESMNTDGAFRISKTLGTRGLSYAEKKPVPPLGLKPKDLVGIPWLVAFALRADGWYLRSDIIWSKPNPMPESVTDRPTKAHEYIFLLSKSQKYFYDQASIAESVTDSTIERLSQSTFDQQVGSFRAHAGAKTNGPIKPVVSKHMAGTPRNDGDRWRTADGGVAERGKRNKRTVWTVTTQPFSDAHFATFPPDLIKPCILAGAPIGGVVLDPFAGSGTTGKVSIELGRQAVLIEPKAEYVEMIKRRCQTTIGLPLAI